MFCEDTLRVKNLPKELTDQEKEEFLKHFGAIKIKILTSKAKQKSVAYAKFETKEVAKNVLQRLHQVVLLRSRLCVEYADHDIGAPKIKRIEENDQNNKANFKSFISRLNAFNESVDFHQPPPPHLKYVYPKANRLTINNIGHALATVPKFYTQVLHLMNKMNLPPPFAVPEPARQQQILQQQMQQQQAQQTKKSSSESEMESDGESAKNKEIIPQKRKLGPSKAIKRPKFIKPNAPQPSTASKSETTENVFEKIDVQTQKKIEMKVPTNVLDDKLKIENNSPETSDKNKSDEVKDVISAEELAANQIPEKDLDVLPVFKNYHPGLPTCRLYIKNIAKNVEMKDLEYIYKRYKIGEDTAEKPSQFEIKLMQEGRMKGQAFITLDSLELAQKAVKETNAFILKDKPLVVVYARSGTVKK